MYKEPGTAQTARAFHIHLNTHQTALKFLLKYNIDEAIAGIDYIS